MSNLYENAENRVATSSENIMRQAGMTAAEYLDAAVKYIDETFGEGYAKNNPMLVGAFRVPPAPERKHTTSWAAFIRAHLAVLAGTDFFTVEVLTLRGLVTYYVLFFIHLESRKVDIAGITGQPDERWMQQMARNVTVEGWGAH